MAQDSLKPSSASNTGEVHGNFQIDAQYYNPDSSIGAPSVPEKMLMNSFANINYTKGNFSAGIRYESYLNAIQGYDPRYKLNSIPYRYASYTIDKFNITAGNFYEQFGSGMILRSYEERGLGIDNSFDGFRVKYGNHGFYFKGLVGTQRYFSSQGSGIVRGFDGEVSLNEVIKSLQESSTHISLGGSFVSKFQSGDQISLPSGQPLRVPLNVGASGGRIALSSNKFNLSGEYIYKINDPSDRNNYIYKPGEAFMVNTSYFQKGFGILVGVKRVDNFSFKSDRTAGRNDLDINFIPSLTKTHTYSLLAFYPYATQPTGEIGYQIDLQKKITKETFFGGKYGTDISLNYSGVNGLDTMRLQPIQDSSRIGYNTKLFDVGKIYFQDLNIEITHKFSNSFILMLMYANQVYNKDVVQGEPGAETIYSNIALAELTYRPKAESSIRMEIQHLSTRQDKGNWMMGLLEYGMGEHWMFSVQDMYNYGNEIYSQRFHYYNAGIIYIKNATRVQLGYGKQRAGIMCVGGVCRYVPALSGATLSITSSF